jgi:hypothetical protein
MIRTDAALTGSLYNLNYAQIAEAHADPIEHRQSLPAASAQFAHQSNTLLVVTCRSTAEHVIL